MKTIIIIGFFFLLLILSNSISLATTMRYYRVEEMTKTSELIIKGKVTSLDTYVDAQTKYIKTKVGILVESCFKGDPESKMSNVRYIPHVEFQIYSPPKRGI